MQHSLSIITEHDTNTRSKSFDECYHSLPDNESNLTAKSLSNPQSNNVSIIGICFMIFGAICYSVLVSFIKWGSNLGYGSMQLLIFKSAMQITIAVPFSMIGICELLLRKKRSGSTIFSAQFRLRIRFLH